MARTRSWFRSALLCGLSAVLACSGTEPTEGLEARPELVYAERDERTLLWSIRGYRDGLGSYEIVPGPKNVPRPASPWTKMRPTTGELLYVAYVAEEPGNARYILLNPSTGEFSRRALHGMVQSWSPTEDLFATYTVNGLQVVTLDGTVQGTLCSGPGICEPVEWTPSGDAVIVARRQAEGLFDLWRVPVHGGAAANLTVTEGASEWRASHSPDGRYLAYSRATAPPDRPGEHDVWVAGADGTDPRQLIAPANPGTLPWSPDGSSVAVYGSVGDQSGVVVVPLTGEPTLISPGEILGIPSDIDWSPDGNRLAYTAEGPAGSNVPGVFLINRDGTGRRLLSKPNHAAATPHWLPPQP